MASTFVLGIGSTKSNLSGIAEKPLRITILRRGGTACKSWLA